MNHSFNKSMTWLGAMLVAASLGAQEPSVQDDSASRLKFMKESAQVYHFATAKPDVEELRLQADAALRWTNPVSGLKDGTLFFWTSKSGRPYAAAQVFLIDSGVWLHEFQSLTTSSFTAVRDGQTIWAPAKPGVGWNPIPNAPIPAKTPIQRLTQMKAIIDRFGANDDFEGKSRWELRSLSKPLLRYASDSEQIVDGATFAFVHTTDPEVFVTLEVYRGDGMELTWRYSLAPMTAYALNVTLDGKTVWQNTWTKETTTSASPYHVIVYKP